MQIHRRARIGIMALLALPATVRAQGTVPQRPDTIPTFIGVVGRSTIRGVPDRATILLVVQSTANTPADAAEAVTRIERAVVDTLTKLGVARPNVHATAYGVGPARAVQGSPSGFV